MFKGRDNTFRNIFISSPEKKIINIIFSYNHHHIYFPKFKNRFQFYKLIKQVKKLRIINQKKLEVYQFQIISQDKNFESYKLKFEDISLEMVKYMRMQKHIIIIIIYYQIFQKIFNAFYYSQIFQLILLVFLKDNFRCQEEKRGLYFIEKILDYKQHNDQQYYLVKWQGYNNKDCTWEKPEKIPNFAQFLHQFEENIKKYGPNFYHSENDEPPKLECFIGTLSLSNWYQNQQEQIKKLQIQIDGLKSEINKMKRQQVEIVSLINPTQQREKYSQPTQQQDSENIQELTQEQSQKNTEIKKQREGGFEFGDQLDKIGQAVQIKNKKENMYYLLWQKRPNGIIPKNRWVDSEYLMKHDIKALCYYLLKKQQ